MTRSNIFKVKSSLAEIVRGKKKPMSWRYHDAIARAYTRIEFQEAFIRSSKLGFSVAHGNFVFAYNTKIMYKFIVDARAAARSGK